MTHQQPVLVETVSLNIDEYFCTLAFRRHGDPDELFSLYEVDIRVNGEPIWLLRPRWIGTPGFPGPAPEPMGVRKLLQLVRGILGALDEWGKRHPHSFVTADDYDFSCLYGTLRQRGIIVGGRFEQWLVFYDALGHRSLFIGMLNLLDEKFYWVNDLWRVAKDTRYYLGAYRSPVDWFKEIIDSGDGQIRRVF